MPNTVSKSKMFRLATILLFLPVYTASAQDWSQWRGPNRDGISGPITSSWPQKLKEDWKVTVGVGHSSPVISNGKVYVFARQGEMETLLCLDLATGKEIWRSSEPIAYEMNPAAMGHGKGPKSTPVVSNGNVCTLGITAVLSCHDAKTGKLKWRREFSKLYPKTSPLYGTAMSPIVDGNLLIAHVGGHDRGALTAFDLATGETKWTNDIDGPAYSSPIIVTLANIRQLVTFTQRKVVGVELKSGQLLWELPAKSRYDTNAVTVVSHRDLLIIAKEDEGLTALRLEKQNGHIVPKEVWNNREVQLYMSTPVAQAENAGLMIGFSTLKKGQIFAIDADTGKVLWLSPGRLGENAAILNVYFDFLVLTNDASLIVLPVNAKYAPSNQYQVADSPTWAHPAVYRDHILIKDETTLRSLSLR